MRRAVAVAMALAAIAAGGAACDKQPTPGGTTTTVAGALPFDGSPSRAALADAGVDLPASATGYRSVRIDESELDIAFDLPAAEVDALVEGLGLPALSEGRAFVHASPVWRLDPPGTVRSASAERDGLRLGLEVVTPPDGGDTVAVRLVVAAPAAAAAN